MSESEDFNTLSESNKITNISELNDENEVLFEQVKNSLSRLETMSLNSTLFKHNLEGSHNDLPSDGKIVNDLIPDILGLGIVLNDISKPRVILLV